MGVRRPRMRICTGMGFSPVTTKVRCLSPMETDQRARDWLHTARAHVARPARLRESLPRHRREIAIDAPRGARLGYTAARAQGSQLRAGGLGVCRRACRTSGPHRGPTRIGRLGMVSAARRPLRVGRAMPRLLAPGSYGQRWVLEYARRDLKGARRRRSGRVRHACVSARNSQYRCSPRGIRATLAVGR